MNIGEVVEISDVSAAPSYKTRRLNRQHVIMWVLHTIPVSISTTEIRGPNVRERA